MQDIVRVSLAQFAPTWLDPEANEDRMAALADEEGRRGADLVVFPELSDIGYITGCGTASGVDPDFSMKYVAAGQPVPGPVTSRLTAVAAEHDLHIVVGLAEAHPSIPATLFNSSVLIGPEGVIGVHHKPHLPNHERHYFCPGATTDVHQTSLGAMGLLICYDLRFPELARVLALRGAEILCVSWSGPGEGVVDLDHIKYRAFTRAQENGCFVLVCNRVGEEGGSRFIGHSVVAAPHGEIIAYADTDEETMLRAELRASDLLAYRSTLNIFRDRRPELYGPVTEGLDPAAPS